MQHKILNLFLITFLFYTPLQAKVLCKNEEAQTALQSYFTCQMAWTKGVCGIVGGYTASRALSALTTKGLMEVFEKDIDIHASNLWGEKSMASEALANSTAGRTEAREALKELAKLNSYVDQSYAYFDIDNPLMYEAIVDDDIQAVAKKDPSVRKMYDLFLSDIKEIDDKIRRLEIQLIDEGNSNMSKIEEALDRAEAERKKIVTKHSDTLNKFFRIVKTERAAEYAKIKRAMVNLRNISDPKGGALTIGGQTARAGTPYDELKPAMKEALRVDARSEALRGLAGNPSLHRIGTADYILLARKQKVGNIARVARSMPRLSPLLASQLFPRMVLYGSGVATFAELAFHSSKVGCGSDIVGKEYISFDPESCKKTHQLDEKAIAFLSLPDEKRQSLSKGNWQIQDHYEKVCEETFNSFHIKDFKCEGNKISLNVDKKGENVKQEILTNGKTSELVLNPQSTTEVRYKFDDQGILSVAAPQLSEQFKNVGTGRGDSNHLLYTRNNEIINSIKNYWSMRMTMYVPAVKECCTKSGRELQDCRKQILGAITSSSVPAQGAK